MKKKTSDARIQANRANALKSTGPRTPAGKAASSQNALTHGLTALTHGLTARDLTARGEDLLALPTLQAAYLASFQPSTPIEVSLINELAALRLRLDRCARMETGLLDPYIPTLSPSDPPSTLNTAVAQAFTSRESSFMNLSRYEAGFSRAYDRTLKQLLALRKEKLDPTPTPEPVPAPRCNETNPIPVENTDPPPSSHRRFDPYIPPPPPAKPTVELVWLDADGNERLNPWFDDPETDPRP